MAIVQTQTIQDLQEVLIRRATGQGAPSDDQSYLNIRRTLIGDPEIKQRLPSFLRECRDLDQFWAFIKPHLGTYAERRTFIYTSLAAVFDYLETNHAMPADDAVAQTLATLDADAVTAIWQKALARRNTDPEGAITSARQLLETVCKHILDDLKIDFDHAADLPTLWRLCADALNLSPDNHQEPAFKTILGNCQSVVQTLGTIRNRLGDAHGTGRRPVRPLPRHAALAVNLAGTMATFLTDTHLARSHHKP